MQSATPLPPLPTSVAEVERLVLSLYTQNTGNQYGLINNQLLELQRSPDGWNMANQLMRSHHAEVRLYAASTFLVKLTNKGSVKDSS